MRNRNLLELLSLLVVAVVAAPTVSRAASFEWLPSLPDYGYANAEEISGDGATVVGECSVGPESGMTEGCRWRAATGWRGLGFLPGHDVSAAAGVSARGTVVVGASFSTATLEQQAFRWTPARGMTGLGFLPGTEWSDASAVSSNGSVIAGVSGGEPFRWTQADGMQGLGHLPGYPSVQVYDLSENGAVVVGQAYGAWPSPREAFRWTQEDGMQGLGFLPAPFDFWSTARAASADGSVVVGASSRFDGDWIYGQAAVWRESCGCLTGLGFLGGGVSSSANDISADGSVIVGSSGARSQDGSYDFHAVIWTTRGAPQKLTDVLKDRGVDVPESLSSADKISADGRWIIGHAYREVSGQLVLTSFRARIDTDITGTNGPDRLIGTPGDDVIDGMGGPDVMTGLAGNDTYFVDLTEDAVVEAANEGADTVKSAATYTLPSNVEKLILTGTIAIDGFGNTLNNTLTGNSANNVLNGKGGADTIMGRDGNDMVAGGSGRDTLGGGPGKDRFRFNAALGSTNVDTIADFSPGDDQISLAWAVFTAFEWPGTLAASAFATGAAATRSTHRILYDPETGFVRYDADGAGRMAAVHFVTLATRPALTRLDFYVQ